MVCGRGFGLAWVVGHRSTGFVCVCVMGFGSSIWFWFVWVLVWHDESAGGFKLGLRLGLLGWWVLAMVLWRFCGGFGCGLCRGFFYFFIFYFLVVRG